MARLFDTQIDDDIQSALSEGGYYTKGFQGGTLGEYRDWYAGAFDMDPFQTASQLGSGAPVPTDVDDPAAFLRRNPLNFSPDAGFTGDPTGLSNQQLGALQNIETKQAFRKEEDERQRGMAMMNWLMGISTKISGTDFAKIAPIGMAQAQASTQYQAPLMDYSGILGIRHADQMAAERREAAKFDFTRDLLPELISLGGILA